MKRLNLHKSHAQTHCSLMGKNATRLRATSAWRALAASGIVAGPGVFAGGLLAGAIWLGGVGPSQAACNLVGTTLTCTGAEIGGIETGDPVETLEVNNLFLPIIPLPGDPGISFISTGPITVNSDTGNLSIITFFADGIALDSSGGLVTLDHEGDISAFFGRGVSVTSVGGADLDIDGDIASGGSGIHVSNTVGGTDTTVIHTGDILSYTGPGIDVATSSTPLTVTNTGVIATFGDGISAVNTSDDPLHGTTVNQTGDIFAGSRGIFAKSDDGDVLVVSEGGIESGDTGIEVLALTGDAEAQQTGDVRSFFGGGIEVVASDGDAKASGSGEVWSYGDGVFAQATGVAGDGTAAVDWTGGIDSEAGKGVYAYSANDDVSVKQYGDIDSYGDGIFADSRGENTSVTVDHTGNIDAIRGAVDSVYGVGIYAYSSTGPVSVTMTGGDIAAAGDGIFAENKGAGSVQVEMTGEIDAGGKGVYAYSTTGSVSVKQYGEINSAGAGIFAENRGSTAVTVDHTGDITSTGDDGIYAYSASGAVKVTMTDGDIDAAGDGVYAQNYGSESVEVAVAGKIQAGTRGISAGSAGGDVDVKQYGELNSYGTGIYAVTTDSGSVTIDRTGNLTSTHDRGIYAYTVNGPVSVTSKDGDISAIDDGIYAHNVGAGAVTVDMTGDILESKDGIDAGSGTGKLTVLMTGDIASTGRGIYADSSGGEVEVKQYGEINSGNDGIFARTLSANSVTVDHTGDITTTDGRGIDAYSSSGPVKVTMTDGDISATSDGIYAVTYGAASIDVEMTGEIDAGGRGINAYSSGGAVTIKQYGELKSGSGGIFATSFADQAVTVDKTGDLMAASGDGIYAYSATGSVKVTMSGGDITASGGDGVYAQNYGSGSVEVELTGDILDAGSRGIHAGSATGNVSVKQYGKINSGGTAIYAVTSDSGTVTVDHTGDITSDGGKGIYAYTVDGTVDVTSKDGDITATEEGIYARNVGIGSVTIDMTGDIVQSTIGIDAASGTGTLTVGMTGDITASGRGVQAYSSGGDVVVNQYGTITSGTDGVHAQTLSSESVTIDRTGNIASAGGDGIYAYSSSGEVKVTMTDGDISAFGDGIFARSKGAGNVEVNFTGDILQAGGFGVFADSVNGEVTVRQYGSINSTDDGIFAQNTDNRAINVDHTGNITSSEGNGIFASSTNGAITVTMTDGDISAFKSGIYASTTADKDVNIEFTGDITQAGDYGVYGFSSSGDVTVKQYGAINSTQDGIYAGTVGSRDILVDHTGDITSTAGVGIQAYSGDGEIEVTHDKGVITAAQDGIHVRTWDKQTVTVGAEGKVIGADDHTGVFFEQGTDNTLANYGTIENAGGITDVAVAANFGDTLVENYGTISGNVDLYEWYNAFNNHSGALFNMGTWVDLGAYDGNVLTNDGTVSPGGVNNVQTTALTGSFTNNADGTMLFDVDMDNSTVDRINATNLASLDGNLQLNFVSVDTTPDDYTILTASNVSTQNLSLVNPFVLGSISYENGDTEVHLSVDGFSFTPTGITGNAAEIGKFINNSFNGGSDGLDPLMLALLNLSDLDAAQDALTQLSPNVYTTQQIAALTGSIGFADKLLSCRVADGAYAFGAEGQCAWARGAYRAQNFDGADGTGFDSAGFDFAAGAQVNGGGDWRFGAAFGVTTSNTDGDNNASSDGTAFQAGAVAKYAPGPYLFAASVSGSWGSYDTTRHVDFVGFSDKLEGDSDVYSLNARLRAAFTVEQNNMYMRPMVDLNATYIHTSAFTESGGVAAISVDGNSDTVFSVSPAIEFGGQAVARNGALLRPYLRGGVSFFSQDNVDLTGKFAADTAGIDSFTITTATDDMLWNVAAGLDVLSMDGKTLQLFYQGNFGDKTSDNLGGIKYSINF